jgi:hypothetical protein
VVAEHVLLHWPQFVVVVVDVSQPLEGSWSQFWKPALHVSWQVDVAATQLKLATLTVLLPQEEGQPKIGLTKT